MVVVEAADEPGAVLVGLVVGAGIPHVLPGAAEGATSGVGSQGTNLRHEPRHVRPTPPRAVSEAGTRTVRKFVPHLRCLIVVAQQAAQAVAAANSAATARARSWRNQ